MLTFINGEPADHITLPNRGLAYGDGVFTTIAVLNAKVQLWQYHWARLQQAADALCFTIPDEQQCYQDVCAAAQHQPDGVIKVTFIRDECAAHRRGYLPQTGKPAQQIISVYPRPNWPLTHWQTGISLAPLAYPLTMQPILAGIKHLNRLENVLAAATLAKEYPAAQEGWCCDWQGNVVSGVKSNVFMIKAGCCYTPLLDHSGVRGVMRTHVLACLRTHHYTVTETTITPQDLRDADAIFMTNALIGVWPVTRIETPVPQCYPVPDVVRHCQSWVAPYSFCPLVEGT